MDFNLHIANPLHPDAEICVTDERFCTYWYVTLARMHFYLNLIGIKANDMCYSL
jgi:hypothetical protein